MPGQNFIDLSPDENAESYITTQNTLAHELDSLSNEERESKIIDFLEVVKSSWNSLKSKGVLDKLDKVEYYHNEMDKSPVKPIHGMPNNKPKFYWWHLNIEYDDETHGCLTGTQLIRGEKTPKDFADNGKNAANALAQLQRLNTILGRVNVCYDVAADTGIDIATVFAIYRVEGDMNFPPSLESVLHGIPTGINDATSSLNPRPDVSTSVMLVSESKYLATFQNVP